MNKYILIIFIHFTIISCGSQKSAVQNQRKPIALKGSSKYSQKPLPIVKRSTSKSRPTAIIKRKTSENIAKDSIKNTATEVIVSTSKTKVTLATIHYYIFQYKDIAMNSMRTNGIPASIILAQAILESGAGSGNLATVANNHFGIKCHKDWTGESVRHDDDALQECFRKYPNVVESFKDYATFLSTRGRYSALFQLPKSDYRSWARGLRAAGYATDPNYAEKLITYIQKYNLHQYDNLVLGIEDKNDSQETAIDVLPSITIAKYNGNTHQIQKGDTFYSLSKKYNISIDELKQKNGLEDDNLSIGQILKIK